VSPRHPAAVVRRAHSLGAADNDVVKRAPVGRRHRTRGKAVRPKSTIDVTADSEFRGQQASRGATRRVSSYSKSYDKRCDFYVLNFQFGIFTNFFWAIGLCSSAAPMVKAVL